LATRCRFSAVLTQALFIKTKVLLIIDDGELSLLLTDPIKDRSNRREGREPINRSAHDARGWGEINQRLAVDMNRTPAVFKREASAASTQEWVTSASS
jgi:hypothetical protein